jgi:plasmid maintenance system antidote protein VapI
MRAYEFDNYKEFVMGRIRSMPKSGRGELGKLSVALKTPSTRLSAIFRGSAQLTLEQAMALSSHFGLDRLETEYVLCSVSLERSGTRELQSHYRHKMKEIRTQAQELVNRVTSEKVLTDQDRATFYSSWIYSAVHIATSHRDLKTLDALALRFNVPRDRMRMIVDFLISRGLCQETKQGIQMGTSRTHLEASSPLVQRSHSNWRLKAMDRHDRLGSNELAFTCQVSVTREDQAAIRRQLVELVESFYTRVEKSEPVETLACLNLDWIEF